MSHTLAFGDDRSEGAGICWQWIVSHRWEGWELEVVTAEAPADMHPVSTDEAELHVWEPEDPRQAPEAGFDSISHLRADVDPRVALISKSWDLVAIGPRGSGLLKSLHMGSTADWLLREPTSPLLVAKVPEPVQRILVAADGSAHAARAIDTLASLPWLASTSIRVVSVDDGKVDTEQALSAAVGALGESGVEAETVTHMGNATRTLTAEIHQWAPQLVVMGARGLSGIKRLVIGSSTAAIAGSSSTSLLVAHATDA
ncbi:MAG TPA: universal stress protein [Acidimicrobiia bacterium]|nr:universal stress protein [Acidimicrobiia bacterium]